MFTLSFGFGNVWQKIIDMVASCCAFGCANRHNKNTDIRFHRFPVDVELQKKWIVAIKRVDSFTKKLWVPSKNSMVCSAHFKPTDYIAKKKCYMLKKGVIPQLFVFAKHNSHQRPLPRRTDQVDNSRNLFITRRQIALDHDYCLPDRPILQRSTVYLRSVAVQKTLRIQRLQAKMRTLVKKVKSLEAELQSLKTVTEQQKKEAKTNNKLPLQLFQRGNKGAYCPEARQFSLTLHLYGPKAYEFLIKQFPLPHPRTLRKWMQGINGAPGISSQSLALLKEKREGSEGWRYDICAITIDAMSIKKGIKWDHHQQKTVGFVDLGSGSMQVLASDVLVVMAMGIKSSWKQPVAYFFTNKVDSDLQAQLLTMVFHSIVEIGIAPVSLTMDGTSTNFSTMNRLGCNTDSESFQTWFPFDPSPFGRIFVFPDPCHMIKLLRNQMGSLKEMKIRGERVSWVFVERLHAVQKSEGLRAANKLSDRHINWQKQKMKVALATQVFSNSVATAIRFAENAGIDGFEGAHATVEFLLLIDKVFDILNSRGPSGYIFKKPITLNTLPVIESFLDVAIKDLLSISDAGGTRLIGTKKGTSIRGLTMCALSFVGLAKLILGDQCSLRRTRFLAGYRLSQDHVELFFNAVRRAGGWCNNPTADKFVATYRRFLGHAGLVNSISGNVIPFDGTEVEDWNVSSDEAILQPALCEIYPDQLSTFAVNSVAYISGWVVRKLLPKVQCSECRLALVAPVGENHDTDLMLLHLRDNGGLIYPSRGMRRIVRIAESVVRGQPIQECTVMKVQCSVLWNLGADMLSIFDNEHLCHSDTDLSGHLLPLIRAIVRTFVDVRQFSRAKTLSLDACRSNIRHVLTKQILFSNQ